MSGRGDFYPPVPDPTEQQRAVELLADAVRAKNELESARADLDAVTRERDLAVAQSEELAKRHSALHVAQTELQRRLHLALARLDATETIMCRLLSETILPPSNWEVARREVAMNQELRERCVKPLPTEKPRCD